MKKAQTALMAMPRLTSQKLSKALALVFFLLASASASALEALEDSDLGGVTGEGIAFALDNFNFRMAPTSFVEVTGTDVFDNPGIAGCSSPFTNCDPYEAPNNWRRGDLRYYGLSITGGQLAAGTDWYGNGCTPGTDGLGCPIGTMPIKDFASVYNPYMIRVFQYAGYDYQGDCRGTETTISPGVFSCSTVSVASSPTFYEFVGPSKGDAWRWSFWGQLLVNNSTSSTNNGGILKSQTIILGKNSTLDGKSTRLQIMQTPTSTIAEQSLSVIYQSRISGNFRFSVQQTGTSSNALNVVPDFNDNEGLYFKNVDAFLPLGQPNYQTVVFRNSGTTGNFIVELTPVVPGTSGSLKAPNTFYCGASTCPTLAFQGGVGVSGSNTATGCGNPGVCNRAQGAAALYSSDTIINPANANADSHGYIYWGSQAGAAPGPTDATNGIYFKDGAGNVSNVGRAMVKGMLIQSLKITSLGAGT